MIPEEAIAAATKAMQASIIADGRNTTVWEEDMEVALEAAAPFIRAQALEDAAGMVEILPFASNAGAAFTQQHIAKQLRHRAVTERGGE